jgi:hypothetical protein
MERIIRVGTHDDKPRETIYYYHGYLAVAKYKLYLTISRNVCSFACARINLASLSDIIYYYISGIFKYRVDRCNLYMDNVYSHSVYRTFFRTFIKLIRQQNTDGSYVLDERDIFYKLIVDCVLIILFIHF